MRDRALFDLAIDNKLRGCDLVKIRIGTLVAGRTIRARSMVIQQKTGRPVQFEITADARASLLAWLERRGGAVEGFAFPTGGGPEGVSRSRLASLASDASDGESALGKSVEPSGSAAPVLGDRATSLPSVDPR
jgi:hypothetical protein